MKKMFYIGAALLTGAMALSAFYAEKPEDMIAARLQTKIDEFNSSKQAECEAKVTEAATVKADSMIAAMPVAKPGKGGKTIAKTPPKKTTPATKGGGTSATTPNPVVVPPKTNPKADKAGNAAGGGVTPDQTQKKADKATNASGGTVTPEQTKKKADKAKAAAGGGGGR